MSELIEVIKVKYPMTKILVGEILPRFYKDKSESKSFERKRIEYNSKLKMLCEKQGIDVIEHSNLTQIDFSDGIHLSQENGIPQFIRNMKEKLNPLLGVTNQMNTFKPSNNLQNSYQGYRQNAHTRYDQPKDTFSI